MEYSYVTYYLNPIEIIILDDVMYLSITDLESADIKVIKNKHTESFMRRFYDGDIVGYCRKLDDNGELFVSLFDVKSVCRIPDYVYTNLMLSKATNSIFNYKEYVSLDKARLDYYNNFMLFNKRCE